MRRRTIALERNGAPLCTRSGCLRTLRGELALVVLSLTGCGACGEYAGNRGVVHDVLSSMLEHLGHGAIVEVTQTTARCGDDDVT